MNVKTWKERVADMKNNYPDIVKANTSSTVIISAMRKEIKELRELLRYK